MLPDLQAIDNKLLAVQTEQVHCLKVEEWLIFLKSG